MPTLAQLQYVLETNTKSLNAAIPSITKLSTTINRLEKTVVKMSSTYQSQMKKVSDSSKTQANVTKKSANDVKSALEKQNNVLISARQRMLNMQASIKAVGGESRLLANTTRAFNVLEKQMKKGVLTTNQLQRSKANYSATLSTVKRELNSFTALQRRNEAAVKSQQSALLKQQNTLERTRQKYLDLRVALQDINKGAQVSALDTTFNDFERSMKRGILTGDEFSKAQNKLNTGFADIKRAAGSPETAIGRLNARMVDLTKSIQVALGPLSGVASRLTAITALANRNNLVIAAAVGGFIALAAVLYKSVRIGGEYERQMLQINSILRSTGNISRISAKEVDRLAKSVADATLASQESSRASAAILLTSKDIPVNSLERALTVAQGLTATGRGNQESNTRKMLRVLERPNENLDTLKESGIQFNEVEKRKIELLVRSGELHEAQNEIFKRTEVLERAAIEQTDGLVGSFDSLINTVTTFLEGIATGSGLVWAATTAFQGLNAALKSIMYLRKAFTDAIGSMFGATSDAAEESDRVLDILQNTADEYRSAMNTIGALSETYDQLAREEENANADLERFNKSQEMFNVLARGGTEESEELARKIRRIGLELEATGGPLRSYITNLETSILNARTDIAVGNAQGAQKRELALAQDVFNRALESGIFVSSDWQKNLESLSDEEREQLTNIMKLTDQLREFNLQLASDEAVRGLDNKLQLLNAEIDLVGEAEVVRERELAQLRARQELLARGATTDQMNIELQRQNAISTAEVTKEHLENVRSLEEQIAAQDKYNSIALMSDETRKNSIALYEKQIELIRKYGSLESTMAKEQLKLFQQLQDSQIMSGYLDQIRGVIEKSFEAMSDALYDFAESGKFDFKSLINSMLKDLYKLHVQLFIIKPLMDMIGGGSFATGGAMLPAQNVLSKLPGFAKGGQFKVGGVGGVDSQIVSFKASPDEVVSVMPKGNNMGGSGISIPINIALDARGSDGASVDRAVNRLKTELPTIIVDTVLNARSRRMI